MEQIASDAMRASAFPPTGRWGAGALRPPTTNAAAGTPRAHGSGAGARADAGGARRPAAAAPGVATATRRAGSQGAPEPLHAAARGDAREPMRKARRREEGRGTPPAAPGDEEAARPERKKAITASATSAPAASPTGQVTSRTEAVLGQDQGVSAGINVGVSVDIAAGQAVHATPGRMKICVLQSCAAGSVFDGIDPECSPAPYLPGHEIRAVQLRKETVATQLSALAKEKFDVFFNLCDGAWDEDRAGAEVVDLLEKLQVPYTGADARFYDPSRADMKRVAIAEGINTPAWATAYALEDVQASVEQGGLEFPMLVKHHNSYSSIGLTRASKVHTVEDLLQQADIMIKDHGGCLIEEFVEGREFTVLVAENPDDRRSPIAYRAVECRFPAGEEFKHFDLKWHDYDGLAWVAVEDADLDARLRDMARKVFVGLNGRGFGRLDVRSNPSGSKLQFLEINPNCGIFYPRGLFGSADEILAASEGTPEGGHRAFSERLIQCALREHERRRAAKRYHALYRKHRGWGIFALRDIRAGELVQENEERPTVICSRRHVQATFDPAKLAQFHAYAYPLSPNTFVTWPDEPSKWDPINHSCDPNTWLDGLNTYARRDVRRGEELTIDYATFCIDNAAFECSCGSALCRGKVTGHDWKLAVSLYGEEHVSDRVLAKSNEFTPIAVTPIPRKASWGPLGERPILDNTNHAQVAV